MSDPGRATSRAMVSTLILNTTFTLAERECPIDIIAFLMHGSFFDDARILQRYRHFFVRPGNDHHKKYIIESCINSLFSAEELILALVNLRLYVNLEEYYTSFGSWSKLLAMYCKRDRIELPTRISEDGTKMILNGLIWVRKQSHFRHQFCAFLVIYWKSVFLVFGCFIITDWLK